MKFHDLREFINTVRETDHLKIVEGVSPGVEIGAVSQIAADLEARPAVLFDSIEGFPKGFRVFTNVISNRKRERLVFNVPGELFDKDAVRYWKGRLQEFRPIPPKEVTSGAVKENVLLGDNVDLTRIPWPKWHEGDGGPYMCGTLAITRDPDSGEICSESISWMLADRNTLAPHVGLGDIDPVWKKYWDQGKPCPVAISLGQDPSLIAGPVAHLPLARASYGFAGWLRGEPVEVTKGEFTDLPIPAAAEVVLEGEITPPGSGEEREGPFGEASGYHGDGRQGTPLVKIKSMLFRNQPIILAIPPFLGINYGALSSRAAQLWNELEVVGIPGITGINHYDWGLTIIAVKQAYPGHPMRIAHGVLGTMAGFHTKFVIVVDEDIDPYNIEKVYWAVATRFEPQTSIDISRRTRIDRGDPRLSPQKKRAGDYTGSVVFIDGCRPYYWMDKFPRTTDIDEALLKKTESKWGKVLKTHA